MGYSLEIKNLSIALEALSRIQAINYTAYTNLEDLLKEAIKKQTTYNELTSTASHDEPRAEPLTPANPF